MKFKYLVLRRLYIADEYIEDLSPNDVCKHWVKDEKREYVRGAMLEITRHILDTLLDEFSENYNEVFDKIFGF